MPLPVLLPESHCCHHVVAVDCSPAIAFESTDPVAHCLPVVVHQYHLCMQLLILLLALSAVVDGSLKESSQHQDLFVEYCRLQGQRKRKLHDEWRCSCRFERSQLPFVSVSFQSYQKGEKMELNWGDTNNALSVSQLPSAQREKRS